MNSSDFARRCIRRLTRHTDGAPSYPWLCVGQRIIAPDELATMPDAEIRALPSAHAFDTLWVVWGCRIWARIVAGLQSRPECGVPVPTCQEWQHDTITTPVVLFWPPYHADEWPELVTWIGKRHEVIDCLIWLAEQPLPPYTGAREPMYNGNTLIDPLPLGDLSERD